ncbi:MAG: HAMP domain-containing sensor histidine kinase, partial [Holophaga sp.]|nr:HAMP domain-containing sensor histidine kinase [Holophaga sp.]
MDSPILFFLVLGAAGMVLVAILLLRRFRLRRAATRQAHEIKVQAELAAQLEERLHVEDTLRRALAMFHLLQDVTAAGGVARTLEEAIQSCLDIVCSYTGWPVAHALSPVFPVNTSPKLQPMGIWHLECPHDYEAFLRAGEKKALTMGKGLPGKAWSSRRVTWMRYMEDPTSNTFFRRALEVGLVMGFAIPVFKNDELAFVLEFFSPPIPNPDDTMLNALAGVGEQLGRMVERVEAEEELAKLNVRLVELNDEKNQFMGIASHDLKNPLNTIGLSGELLATGDLATEEVIAIGNRIAQEAHRASHLIQKLLDVTAIESGKFNLKFGQVSLGDVLMYVQAKYQDRAQAKGQAITLDFGGQDVLVWADPEYLQEVLDNLVSNALKFMAPGPPLHTVNLRLSCEEGVGIVEVEDEGPGFS